MGRPALGGRVPSLILDSGAVIALTRRAAGVVMLLAAATKDEANVFVPPAVVSQTIRGGPRDAPVNRLLKNVDVPPVDVGLARMAGYLLGSMGGSDVADAQVVAEALRRRPSVILTSDPDDMRRLIGNTRDILIVQI